MAFLMESSRGVPRYLRWCKLTSLRRQAVDEIIDEKSEGDAYSRVRCGCIQSIKRELLRWLGYSIYYYCGCKKGDLTGICLPEF